MCRHFNIWCVCVKPVMCLKREILQWCDLTQLWKLVQQSLWRCRRYIWCLSLKFKDRQSGAEIGCLYGGERQTELQLTTRSELKPVSSLASDLSGMVSCWSWVPSSWSKTHGETPEGRLWWSSCRPTQHPTATGWGNRSSTAWVSYKTAAASLLSSKSQSSTSPWPTVHGNIPDREFWEM